MKFLWRWSPPLLVMGIIYWFSSQTTLPGPSFIWWDFLFKKGAHVFVFGSLFYTVQRALNWGRAWERRTYLLTFVIVLAYAIFDEIHQSFTPGRHPKIMDIGFDMLGAFLVYYLVKFEFTSRS